MRHKMINFFVNRLASLQMCVSTRYFFTLLKKDAALCSLHLFCSAKILKLFFIIEYFDLGQLYIFNSTIGQDYLYFLYWGGLSFDTVLHFSPIRGYSPNLTRGSGKLGKVLILNLSIFSRT